MDSLFRSALRESAQYSMLKDVLDRKGPRPVGPNAANSSMVLDANMEASFYWLDRFRDDAAKAEAAMAPGPSGGGEIRRGGGGVMGSGTSSTAAPSLGDGSAMGGALDGDVSV